MTGFLFGGGGSALTGLDWKSVKDFGALGDNIQDDTPYIQAAINWTVETEFRGVIYFPPGTYKVTESILLPNTNQPTQFILQGSGANSTVITGTFADYIFKRDTLTGAAPGPYAVRDMRIDNYHLSGGGLIINSTHHFEISHCFINAQRGVTAYESCFNASIRDCLIMSSPGGFPPPSGGFGVGIIGDHFHIENCRLQGHDCAIKVGLSGVIINCSMETNQLGIMWGTGPDGGSVECGGSIIGCGMEAGTNGFYLLSANTLTVLNSGTVGNPSSADAQGNIDSISWSGGTVTVVTESAHGLPATCGITIGNVTPSAYNTGNFPVVATITNSTTFTYPLVANPGGSATSGSWWKISDYGFKIRTGPNANLTLIGCTTGGPFFDGALTWESDAAGYGVTFIGCNFADSFTGHPDWALPTNPTGLNCIGSSNPTLAVPFAQLPGGASTVLGFDPVEGMVFDITDGQKTGAVPLTGSDLGAVVIGGGSQHVKVRYNGTNWTCMGF